MEVVSLKSFVRIVFCRVIFLRIIFGVASFMKFIDYKSKTEDVDQIRCRSGGGK